MRSLYVSVPDDTVEKLRLLAARERRAPRQQAAVLLMDALSRLEIAGELRPDGQAPREPGEGSVRVRAAATVSEPAHASAEELSPERTADSLPGPTRAGQR